MDLLSSHNNISPSSRSGETGLGAENDQTVIRSLSMSANVANSVKEEVNHLIRLNVEEQASPELIHDGQPRMPANIAMASSSCSHILPKGDKGLVIGFVLSKWDDIIGPQTVHVWLEESSNGLKNHENNEEPTACYHESNVMIMKAIKYVTGHTVNYMGVSAATPRIQASGSIVPSTFNEKNTSLFVVSDLDILAHSLVFCVQNEDLNIPYSIALIVTYKNYKCYLNLHRICQLWLRRLADHLHQLILTSNHSGNEFVTNDQVNDWVLEFNLMLVSLTTSGLGIPALIQECDKTILSLPCMERALVSHLQTFGCSVVMGTSTIEINALIEFFALFVDERELYFCRYVDPLHKYSYHMGLFLQGLVLDEYGCRQWCAEELAANPNPVTAIDLSRGSSTDAVKQYTPKHRAWHSRHQSMFTAVKSSNSKLVQELLVDLQTIPANHWKKMAKLFMKKVKSLALILLNLEEKIRGTDKSGIKTADLQRHLRLAMDLEEADFLIVQSMAKKIKSGNCF